MNITIGLSGTSKTNTESFLGKINNFMISTKGAMPI